MIEFLLKILILKFVLWAQIVSVGSNDVTLSKVDFCTNEVEDGLWPMGPLVPCEFLDARWIQCEDVAQAKALNNTKVCFFGYLFQSILNVFTLLDFCKLYLITLLYLE